ncbi:hypothetical protein BX600DRAFT_500003 [Xylariales sp. PMI_506]|nr:hypothetical protein BX600DRAFT_500003 [Xylariales sp. PMI_506]
MSRYELNGKVAIVTGAGSGINYALAAKLLAAGTSVVAADIKLRPEADETIAKHPHPPKEPGAPSAIYVETDTGNWASINSLWEAALSAFGRVDIVVNGAAIYEPLSSSFWNLPGISPLAKDDPNAVIGQYKSFGVNTIGPIQLAQIAIDYSLQHPDIQVTGSFEERILAFAIVLSALVPFILTTPIFHQEYCKDRVRPEDLTMTPDQCAEVAMDLLTEPQYGDGNVVEAMLIGKRGEATVHTREVPLEALYPTVGPVGENNHLLEEEQKFVQKVKVSGMR